RSAHYRGQDRVAGDVSPSTPRTSRFRGPDALSRILFCTRANANRWKKWPCPTGAVHWASIERLKRAACGFEGSVSVLLGDAERTWQLTLSQLRNLQGYQLLTFAESERRLDELLHVK